MMYLNNSDPIKCSENFADECTNAVNFGASMTLIFVGPSRSDTSNLSRKGALSMTIMWNSWSDLFPIDVLLRANKTQKSIGDSSRRCGG